MRRSRGRGFNDRIAGMGSWEFFKKAKGSELSGRKLLPDFPELVKTCDACWKKHSEEEDMIVAYKMYGGTLRAHFLHERCWDGTGKEMTQEQLVETGGA